MATTVATPPCTSTSTATSILSSPMCLKYSRCEGGMTLSTEFCLRAAYGSSDRKMAVRPTIRMLLGRSQPPAILVMLAVRSLLHRHHREGG
jgi:hypothetical protein